MSEDLVLETELSDELHHRLMVEAKRHAITVEQLIVQLLEEWAGA